MNRLKKMGIFLLSICMLGVMIPNEAFAASAKVSVSSASGKVGSTVTVSCTATMSGASIGGTDVTLAYDPAALELQGCSSGANGSSGGIYFSQSATASGQSSLGFSVTFKILKEGTHSVSVTYADVFDWDTAASVSTSKSGGSVTGKAVTTNNNSGDTGNNNSGSGDTGNNNSSSGNAGNNNSGSGNTGNNDTTTQPEENNKDSNSKLSSLRVSPGSLSPAFQAGTTFYTVKVPGDTTKVTFSATAQSDKAKVSVSGGTNLKLGPNSAKVVVTAENGNTTVYNITIMCGEIEKITVGDKEYTINENIADDQIPNNFVREKITYKDRQYEGLSFEKGDMQLISLKNDATESVFYIYEQESQTFYPFTMISIAEGKYIIPLRVYETTAFAEMTTLLLQDKQFDAWKIDEEFSVIPVMNAEGEEVLYKYDQKEGTYQRYSEAVPEEVIVEEEQVDTFLEYVEQYDLYIIIGLSVLVIILLIALICCIATRKNKYNVENGKY